MLLELHVDQLGHRLGEQLLGGRRGLLAVDVHEDDVPARQQPRARAEHRVNRRDAPAGADQRAQRLAQRRLQRAYVDYEAARTALGERLEDLGRGLERRGDDDEIVVDLERAPIVDARERQRGPCRVGERDLVSLRGEKTREPPAHLARAADDQRALAAAVRAGLDTAALLRRQRSRYELAHDALDEIRVEAKGLGLLSRAFQDFALALIIPRRSGVFDLVRTDLGNDALALGEQRDDLAVDRGQALAQILERHRALRVGRLYPGRGGGARPPCDSMAFGAPIATASFRQEESVSWPPNSSASHVASKAVNELTGINPRRATARCGSPSTCPPRRNAGASPRCIGSRA